MDVKKQANKIARMFKSRDPFEIVRGLNVILVHYPLDGVRGFYQYFQRNNIIYLDDRLSDSEKRFVLAHELGHMFYIKKQMQFLWIPERSSTEPDMNVKLICLLWNFCFRMKCCLNIRRWGIQLIRYPALQDIIKD